MIVETGGPGATVHLGFARDVEADTLRDWVDRQDSAALLGSLHALTVEPGDAVLVPAGVPHAIGEGVFLIELQEPTDLSVLLEWEGFAVDGRTDGHLGLGYDVALQARGPLRLRSGADRRPAQPHRSRPAAPPGRALGVRGRAPTRYFRAEEHPPEPARPSSSPASRSSSSARATACSRATTPPSSRSRRGDTILVPYAAGNCELAGEVEVVRCRPPSPSERAA